MNSYKPIVIEQYVETDKVAWDDFVISHPNSNLYHLSGWKNVIEKTYGHKTYYLKALDAGNSIVGILPLVHLKHFIFGNNLISIPYFDMCGILANDDQTAKNLFQEAVKIGNTLKVDSIDLRHGYPINFFNEINQEDSIINYNCDQEENLFAYEIRDQKVRMVMELPDSSDVLMKSFTSKFRNNLNRSIREGLKCEIGGIERLDDFYAVFARNMRDLGSPVHSRQFIENVLNEFPEKAKIGIVYNDDNPIACIMVIGFKNILANPWSSALKEFRNLRANMLQYWVMLEYACDNNYAFFDFGRSSPDEGTYTFKANWGAKSIPLHWYYISKDEKTTDTASSKKTKFETAIKIWQKIPVSMTKIIGPAIRKNISL